MTHSLFADAILKCIVCFPQCLDVVERDAHCLLICLAQNVLLLLFFPLIRRLNRSARRTRLADDWGTDFWRSEKFDVFLPNYTTIAIGPAHAECVIVCLSDGRAIVARCGSIDDNGILASDVVQICFYSVRASRCATRAPMLTNSILRCLQRQ